MDPGAEYSLGPERPVISVELLKAPNSKEDLYVEIKNIAPRVAVMSRSFQSINTYLNDEKGQSEVTVVDLPSTEAVEPVDAPVEISKFQQDLQGINAKSFDVVLQGVKICDSLINDVQTDVVTEKSVSKIKTVLEDYTKSFQSLEQSLEQVTDELTDLENSFSTFVDSWSVNVKAILDSDIVKNANTTYAKGTPTSRAEVDVQLVLHNLLVFRKTWAAFRTDAALVAEMLKNISVARPNSAGEHLLLRPRLERVLKSTTALRETFKQYPMMDPERPLEGAF